MVFISESYTPDLFPMFDSALSNLLEYPAIGDCKPEVMKRTWCITWCKTEQGQTQGRASRRRNNPTNKFDLSETPLRQSNFFGESPRVLPQKIMHVSMGFDSVVRLSEAIALLRLAARIHSQLILSLASKKINHASLIWVSKRFDSKNRLSEAIAPRRLASMICCPP